MNKEETKMLSPKIDVVFQALFGEIGSEKITKKFLESILKEKITEIDLSKNPILRRETLGDKLGILDVIVKINKEENCDIELQVVEQEKIIERIIYYWSKLYARQIKVGEDYDVLEKAIVILITDKNIKKLEGLKYHTEWKIIENEKKEKILTDKLELHIIELDKIRKEEENKKDELIDWLSFIINPESERVKEKMKKNKELKEAGEKLKKISEDEQMQQIAWWREKAILEENTNKKVSFNKGIEQGEKKEKIKIAKEMLKQKIDINIIITCTGLTKEEILNLKH